MIQYLIIGVILIITIYFSINKIILSFKKPNKCNGCTGCSLMK
jgi:hypothetical protein